MTEDPVVDREAACSDAAAAEAGAAEAGAAAADGSVAAGADGSVAEESEDDEVDSFTSDLAASEDPDFNDWAICSFSCFKLVTRLLNIFSCLLIVI